jgi:hypothetical protein
MDPDEPLPFREDLDWGLAPPAGPDPLLEFLLPLQDTGFFHIAENCLPAGLG